MEAAPGGVRVRVVWVLRWLPWVGLLGAAAVLLGGLLLNQMSWNGNGPTGGRWQACAGKLTAGELREIAAGKKDGREFVEGLRRCLVTPWSAGDERIAVRLMDWSGTRYDTVTYGWPVTLLNTQMLSQFEDVFEKTGPVARDWGVESHGFWTQTSTTTSGGAVTPSRTARYTNAGPWAVVVLIVVGAGYVGVWMGGRWGHGGERKKRRRVGAVIGAALGAGVLLVAGVGTRTVQAFYTLEPTHATYGAPTPPAFVTSDTGWKQRELLALLATKDGAPAVATKLLSVLPEDEEPEKVVEFGMMWTPGPFAETTVGWPWWMTWGHEDLAAGSTRLSSGWRKKGWHINEDGQGQVWYAWDSAGKRKYFGVFVPELATLVLLGWVVWKVLRLVERMAEWRLVGKRVKRGWCVGCGYDLVGIRGPNEERLGLG